MQSNKTPQFKSSYIDLFNELQPGKQCSKNVSQEPLKHGFQVTDRNVFYRGVKAPNNESIIAYQIISNNRISYAPSLQGFMSETMRSLLLECRAMIEDLNQLKKNEKNRPRQDINEIQTENRQRQILNEQ